MYYKSNVWPLVICTKIVNAFVQEGTLREDDREQSDHANNDDLVSVDEDYQR